jgi:UDPglucose 6-dehydrogenase
VEAVNKRQRKLFVEKVVAYFGQSLKGRKITIWGLSFKPKTNDMREAPSITVIEDLHRRGAVVHVYDPIAMEEAKKLFGTRVKYFQNDYDALRGADALIVVTEWSEFRRPDFDRMASLMRERVIFDGRNIYDPRILREKGFTYFSIGREAVHAAK